VLFLEVPPFDVLTGQAEPYVGFGEAIVDSQEFENVLIDTERRARNRISEVFGVQWDGVREVIPMLEAIVNRMWEEGWSSNADETNLFAADFGCILYIGLHQMFGGRYVFRSPSDLSHASLWWQQKGVEAFPFHKVYKRLIAREGESLSYFADHLKQLVSVPLSVSKTSSMG
jgi:hypothetical protein